MLGKILGKHKEKTSELISEYSEKHKQGNLNLEDEVFLESTNIPKTIKQYEDIMNLAAPTAFTDEELESEVRYRYLMEVGAEYHHAYE